MLDVTHARSGFSRRRLGRAFGMFHSAIFVARSKVKAILIERGLDAVALAEVLGEG